VVKSPDHARPIWFYLPVVLVGALPATFLMLRREARTARPPLWHARLLRSLVILLVLFTLISGKQAHYLVPAAPALALVLAWRLETSPLALTALRRGLRVELALFLVLALGGLLALAHYPESFSSEGKALLASGRFRIPLALMLVAAACGWFVAERAVRSARGLLVVAVATWGACLVPLQWLAGELLFPHDLAGALHDRPAEIAYLGTSHHGLYSLLAQRTELDHLLDSKAIPDWLARNPDGVLLVDPEELGVQLEMGLVTQASDTVHRTDVLVLRAPSASAGR
jgi:4-amino-4-deoxy-L-arabinose transferase-like glycosyltransferase